MKIKVKLDPGHPNLTPYAGKDVTVTWYGYCSDCSDSRCPRRIFKIKEVKGQVFCGFRFRIWDKEK